MQKFISTLVLLMSFSLLSAPARAQTAVLDSVTEKKIIQTVGTEMCRQLALENTKRPLDSLSATEGSQLFMRLMMVSAAASPELMDLFSSQPDNAKLYGQQVGRNIGMWLIRECPMSQPLLMQLGVQTLNRRQPLSAAEQSLLKPLSIEVCNQLEARGKKQDLKALSTEKRQALLQEIITASVSAHAKELTLVYGKSVVKNDAKMREIGTKLGVQMATQCPDYLLLISGMK